MSGSYTSSRPQRLRGVARQLYFTFSLKQTKLSLIAKPENFITCKALECKKSEEYKLVYGINNVNLYCTRIMVTHIPAGHLLQ
jgi:hypothetical protein